MKAIELNLPDDVYEKLENLASHDHQSVNAFTLRKLEELARAFEDFRELERRAKMSHSNVGCGLQYSNDSSKEQCHERDYKQ